MDDQPPSLLVAATLQIISERVKLHCTHVHIVGIHCTQRLIAVLVVGVGCIPAEGGGGKDYIDDPVVLFL